jgi:hypothetical protein
MSVPIRQDRLALHSAAVLRRPTAARRRARLPLGWPLAAAYLGYPLWWLLGIRTFVFLLAAIPLAFALLGRRQLRAPRGFGVWLLFLAWVVVGFVLLGAQAPGAKAGDIATRYLSTGYRLAWYLALTVVLLYVGNLSEQELSTRRVCRWLSALFIVTVAGGYLGIIAPHFQFRSAIEHLAPAGVAHSSFFVSLTHPVAAQVQDFLGYAEARPAAPYAYTNDWGANFGLLLPFFVLEWFRRDGGRRRWFGIGVVAVSIVPVVESLNRGLWIGLGAIAVFVVLSSARSGRFVALGGLAVGAAVLAIAIAVTPLKHTVERRLAVGQSNSGRAALASRTVSAVVHVSPIVGFGATRNIQGNFNTIGGGATPDCPQCSPPAMGTQGHIWLVLFSQGFVGAALFFWFLLRRFLPYVHDRDPFAIAATASFIFFLVVVWVYDLLDVPMMTVMLALALLWRMHRPATAGEPESAVVAEGLA